MKAPEIITPRLTLSRLVAADAPDVLAYRSRDEVSRYQNFAPTTLGEVEEFIAALAEDFDVPGTWFQLGIRLADTGGLIGDLGARFLTEDSSQVEIGITLSPAHQRQGYGAEALRGLLDFLFGVLDKHRVFASVAPRNAPSVGLLERVGMRQEAHFRQSLRFRGAWADDVIFAMLRAEWAERRDQGR